MALWDCEKSTEVVDLTCEQRRSCGSYGRTAAGGGLWSESGGRLAVMILSMALLLNRVEGGVLGYVYVDSESSRTYSGMAWL